MPYTVEVSEKLVRVKGQGHFINLPRHTSWYETQYFVRAVAPEIASAVLEDIKQHWEEDTVASADELEATRQRLLGRPVRRVLA